MYNYLQRDKCEDANVTNIEYVPETQIIHSSQVGQVLQKPMQKVARNKEVKGVAKKSFKKSITSTSKSIERIEEVINKDLRIKKLKSKQEERILIFLIA